MRLRSRRTAARLSARQLLNGTTENHSPFASMSVSDLKLSGLRFCERQEGPITFQSWAASKPQGTAQKVSVVQHALIERYSVRAPLIPL